MIFPLLQPERSIDDFVDKEDGCRLSALLADAGALSQEEKLYTDEVRGLVRQALGGLDDRERHIIRNRFGLLGGKELTPLRSARWQGIDPRGDRQDAQPES